MDGVIWSNLKALAHTVPRTYVVIRPVLMVIIIYARNLINEFILSTIGCLLTSLSIIVLVLQTHNHTRSDHRHVCINDGSRGTHRLYSVRLRYSITHRIALITMSVPAMSPSAAPVHSLLA
jgi:hypothetical protein